MASPTTSNGQGTVEETTVVTTTTTTTGTAGDVGSYDSSAGGTFPGVSVAGGTATSAAPRAVAVYRTNVPNSRVYVGRKYEQAEATQGFLIFKPTGSVKRHPHNRDAIIHSLGELCVWEPCLIARLDKAVRSGTVAFWRVTDPQPIQP